MVSARSSILTLRGSASKNGAHSWQGREHFGHTRDAFAVAGLPLASSEYLGQQAANSFLDSLELLQFLPGNLVLALFAVKHC